MLRNYLIVGVRSLLKNRAYAVINIFGLAIGIAACLLILLYVRDQESFDRFVPDHERVYQLQSRLTDTETGRDDPTQMSPFPSGAALAKDYAAVETQAWFGNSQPIILDRGQPILDSISITAPNFFTIFPVTFVHGDAATALKDPNSVAISTTYAHRFFGTEDAVGKTITTIDRGAKRDLRVSAIFKPLPKNTHQAFGIVRSYSDAEIDPQNRNSWGNYNGYTYVKLRKGADVAAINATLDSWKDREAPKNMVGGVLESDAHTAHYTLVPLADIHLGQGKGGPHGNEGDRTTVYTFAVLAVLILVMACVNFTNLATARGSQRAREVSLRKVLGASRRQLVVQFLTESIIVASLATLLGLAIVEVALPFLRSYLDAELNYSYFGHDGILLPAIGLVLLVGIAGGAYPAFFLTRFRPAQVLKANRSGADPHGSGRLRNALVIGQFAISIGLIICTTIVFAQLQYARSVDPGFSRDGVLQIENASRTVLQPIIETLTCEIERVPGVVSTARTSIGINTSNRTNQDVLLPGRAKPLIVGAYSVGFGYPETLKMRLIAGRTLDRSHALDDATVPEKRDDAAEQALVRRGMNVVVNESAARRMGFTDPASALGKQFRLSLVSYENGTVPATIVGVVGDTRLRSTHEPAGDMIFYHDANYSPWLEVRIQSNDPVGVRNKIEAVWKHMTSQLPFDADFADERAARMYKTDAAVGQIFAAFAVLSVIVGCLGLYGLASFTAERRTKEIGIRKVLGARTRDIVRLLVWQFCQPVIIANLIAWPVAWWVMRGWLDRFDLRIALIPIPFMAAGGLALVIAIGTIAGHAMSVARANPIKALRYE